LTKEYLERNKGVNEVFGENLCNAILEFINVGVYKNEALRNIEFQQYLKLKNVIKKNGIFSVNMLIACAIAKTYVVA